MPGRVNLHPTLVCSKDPIWSIARKENSGESDSWRWAGHKWHEHAIYTLLLCNNAFFAFLWSLDFECHGRDFDEFDFDVSRSHFR